MSVNAVNEEAKAMNLEPTESMMARATAEWSQLAKEPVTMKSIKGFLYAFGSELACLRLWATMKRGRAAYSTNLGTWYYCNE
jgi:hypothetical protein